MRETFTFNECFVCDVENKLLFFRFSASYASTADSFLS